MFVVNGFEALAKVIDITEDVYERAHGDLPHIWFETAIFEPTAEGPFFVPAIPNSR